MLKLLPTSSFGCLLSFTLFLIIERFSILFQILSQDLLKKYITYAKLNIFPRFHDSDMEKLTQVYAELRRESSVRLIALVSR